MSDWISCKERLPELAEDVLLLYKDKTMAVGELNINNDGGRYWYIIGDPNDWHILDEEITHWMPLPQPPEES